jgi:GNAT superfamily N-acetyltransferase
MSTVVPSKRWDFNREDWRRLSDVLRLQSGRSVTVRFVEPQDGKALQAYFGVMSPLSRYNRFTGASSGLSDRELDLLLHIGERDRFAVLVEMMVDDLPVIVGEARYMFDESADSLEFGLSVHEAYRGQGIGMALLSNLECRAAALGAHRIFGDTLRTNNEMKSLARKAGFSFSNTPDDWRELRLTKPVTNTDDNDIPCARARSLRIESQTRSHFLI